MGTDEWLWVSIGGFGATGDASLQVVPNSWLHMNDNIMDPFHVHVLHSTLSVIQFHAQFALMPKVDFFHADHGICYSAVRQLDDGQEVDRISTLADAEYHERAGHRHEGGAVSGNFLGRAGR